MNLSPEDFFLYLTVALIVIIPVSVRIHRYLTRNRAAEVLRKQFEQSSASDTSDDKVS